MRLAPLILIAAATALSGCGKFSKREARFFHDREVVNDTIRSCFNRPYEGLIRPIPGDSNPDPDFPGEDFIHRYIHSSTGWYGDGFYRVRYRPVSTEASRPPVDAAKVLEHYFGNLETSGFTSGMRGFGPSTTTDSLQVADKLWANKGRTILVTGQVVSNKRTGEILITVFRSENFN